MAFLFVDRITDLDPGRRARGRFTVPRQAPFAPALAAEAVGQLAAWAAMAATDFTRRPLAALAGEVRFGRAPLGGDVVELAIEIEPGGDGESIAYGGWARVAGDEIVVLRDCVGAMLPLADFDSAESARRRCDALCRGSLAPAASVTEALTYAVVERGVGERVEARLDVPAAAPFFADHFPRRPVLPGTLLLDALARLAAGVASEALPGASLRLDRVGDVKLRTFLAPGASLELAAEVTNVAPGAVELAVRARCGGRRAASGRVLFRA